MKVMLSFLLFSALISLSWTNATSFSSSAQLSSAALSQYLLEMKTNFDWTPTTVFVKSEQVHNKQLLEKRFGATQVLVRSEAELLAYSLQHAGKTLLYLTLEVKKEENEEYVVYVVNEGLKTVLKDGLPKQEEIEAPLGRACVLHYDTTFHYQGIDCLLLPEDPEEE